MVLAAGGIRATQAKIAKDVFLPWWGVTQQAIYAYLSKYFKSLNFKSNGTIADLTKRLKEGKVIIVNWWDDLEGLDDEDGHYTLLLDVDKKNKKVSAKPKPSKAKSDEGFFCVKPGFTQRDKSFFCVFYTGQIFANWQNGLLCHIPCAD